MAKQRAQRRAGSDWIFTWPLLVVFAAIVFLAVEEMRTPVPEPSAPTTTGGEWKEQLGERVEILDRALEGSELRLPEPVQEPKGAGALRWIHRRFELDLPQTDREKLDAVLDSLKRLDPGVTVTSHPAFDGVEVQIGLDGLLMHTIRVHWRDQQVHPRVALVVGPLGDDLRLARECVRVEAPLALIVRPFRPFSRQVAELGKIFEREILVEIGGERPPPSTTPGAEDGVAEFLARALASVPNAVGVSGDAAAALPGDGAALRQAVQERGLFFIASPAAQPAPEGEGAALFVLDQEEASGIEPQIERLVARARSGGAAIGFGRSNEATVSALGPMVEQLRKEEIELVPVSTIAAGLALSAR